MSANVEYTLDETGKIISLTIDGKNARGAHMRGLKKAQTAPYWKLYKQPQVAVNPFSGVKAELTGFEYSLYAFCLNWYRRYSNGEMDLPVQAYDDVKYILLEVNTEAYYDLLD